MTRKDLAFGIITVALLCGAAAEGYARQAPSPTPPAQTAAVGQDEQDSVEIFTQEVRLPVVAYDERERFDPTLSPDDILVLEDGVPQKVSSVRRAPASVLLILDMGSRVTATRNTGATREAALRLVSTLRAGDRIAVIQNSRRVELLQDWTTDLGGAAQVLKIKFFTSDRSRLSECLMAAARKLKEQPVGNTHVVVFTDGLEAQTGGKAQAEIVPREGLQRLAAAQASVHIFGFASLVADAVRDRNSAVTVSGGGNTVKVIVDTDLEMRRWFREYARAAGRREEQLVALAQETGGRVLRPSSPEEFVELAEKVSRDIGAQYVVTYTPRRRFTAGPGEERRRVNVHPRRIGLQLFSLRSVVVRPTT